MSPEASKGRAGAGHTYRRRPDLQLSREGQRLQVVPVRLLARRINAARCRRCLLAGTLRRATTVHSVAGPNESRFSRCISRAHAHAGVTFRKLQVEGTLLKESKREQPAQKEACAAPEAHRSVFERKAARTL